MTNDLNEFEINEIMSRAMEKLGLCRKGNDIIGTQIFSILRLYARVIYYPLGNMHLGDSLESAGLKMMLLWKNRLLH